MTDDRATVRAALRDARRILVLTGAGISAESGIPTFRGRDGWWRREDPSKLATPEAFRRDPSYVWEWYQYRRELIARAEPNAGHRALAAWDGDDGNGSRERSGAGEEAREGSGARRVLVVTQNVDDLHERAGSRRVVHLHGSIWRVRCIGCGREEEDHTVPFPALPPSCDACGGVLRPAVVWFGESVPAAPFQAVQSFLRDGVDLALVIGTEAVFGYVQALALEARGAGALLVEVNPGRTALSGHVDVRLEGPAGEVLPALG